MQQQSHLSGELVSLLRPEHSRDSKRGVHSPKLCLLEAELDLEQPRVEAICTYNLLLDDGLVLLCALTLEPLVHDGIVHDVFEAVVTGVVVAPPFAIASRLALGTLAAHWLCT